MPTYMIRAGDDGPVKIGWSYNAQPDPGLPA